MHKSNKPHVLPDSQVAGSCFSDDAADPPPGFDPFQAEWEVAVKYYPDLRDLNAHLSSMSWRLADSFRAYLLTVKQFDNRQQVAEEMQANFLDQHFGSNPGLTAFAHELIDDGHKRAAKALNEAVHVLGIKTSPEQLIRQIRKEYLDNAAESDSALMRRLGISYDGRQYQYHQYHYDNLADAVTYAEQQQAQKSKP